MDQSPLQQTVIESREADSSIPQGAALETQAETSDATQEQAYELPSYDELFPALPNSFPPSPSSSKLITNSNNWSKNSDMRIASSVITQVFRVPFEERAKLDENTQFGENASSQICTKITAETGAHIEISSAKDQSLTFLVTGKNDEVAKAKRMALENFQTQAEQVVKIPKEHHRFILGKKGKKLQDLELATGTKISMPNAASNSDEIKFSGTKESIENAVHEVKRISYEQSKQAREKLMIPRIYRPLVCGPNNEWINTLGAENGVKVNVPPLGYENGEIDIVGEKEGVQKVKDIILKKYREMEKKCQTVSVEVKKPQHRHVLGSRGINVAEILQKTNVSVELPPQDDSSETITLRGPQDKLGAALTMVYAKANSVITETVKAPVWLHKFIIGRKGANIKEITQDLKLHVEFRDEGDIKLEGQTEDVQSAAQKLETTISDLQTKLTHEELPVDPQYQKHIIGKNGANIRRLTGTSNLHISLGEVDGKTILYLEGSRQSVSNAKKELLELIHKMENEREMTVNIEQRFHGNLIGTKGEKIREIREQFNQVQISFPDAGERSDGVKIRGSKVDVEKCYQYLRRLGKELSENNHVVHLNIDRSLHKYIIGKGGANIAKIRDETGVRIELPSEWQNSDEITISGKKDGCEKAKEKILKIQNESANITEKEIMIPAKFHNALIGTGGKLIQSISEECGLVSIKFPSAEMKSDKVSIRGAKDDVMKAKQMLIDLSNEKQLSSHTAEVRAKPQHHRFLIGKNGSKIRKIRDDTGARIVFPNEKDNNKEIITIIGKKESVESAKKELINMIEELNKISEETFNVDQKHHRHFVARRGEVIRQISDQFGGVIISFPRQGEASNKVKVSGAKECVSGAVTRIKEIASELDSIVSLNVYIPHKHHRIIVGPRGSRMQTVTAEYDVQIKFPDRDNQYSNEKLMNGDAEGNPQDLVVVEGKKENCELAKEALLALIPITEEIPVSFSHHRFIIGQKGETVRSLMNDFEVNIQVPPADQQKDSIVIVGPPTKVEACKAAILKKIEGNFQIQIRIDPEYHPKIIGHKGTVISRIRKKHNVTIRFPMKDSPESDLITIIGYEKDCNEAKNAILTITGDLANMVKENVEIDSRIHSRLIGFKGKSIRKIMEDFKVEIKFPRGDDDQNQVVIMGAPDDVEDCREHLLNMAEEFMQDIADREDMQFYMKPLSENAENGNSSSNMQANSKGFVVSGAPWTQPAPNMESSEEFPSMGSGLSSTPSVPTHWGPRSN